MIIVYDKNDTAKVIRPCPLISLVWNANNTANGNAGGSYSITLNGSIIADEGSPLIDVSAENGAEFKNAYTPRPESQIIGSGERLGSILKKQVVLRSLFADACNKVEVLSIDGNEPVFYFYPKLSSISFEEGVWVDTCRYSINLEADYLLNKGNQIIGGPSYGQGIVSIDDRPMTLNEHIKEYGGLISDFSESWSLEPQDGNGITTPYAEPPNDAVIRTYRLTRNLSAVGKTLSNCNGDPGSKAFIQAKGFLKKYLESDFSSHGYDAYIRAHTSGNKSLTFDAGDFFGSGFIYLSAQMYGGFNHSRSESFDVSNGSYNIVDTWLLSSGTAYENYTSSISSTSEDSLSTISINGTIKGLSSMPPSGYIYGGDYRTSNYLTPYQNAINKYNYISISGTFGLTSELYKRARRSVNFDIHPTPKSISTAHNEFTGEITYNIDFDNRPISLNIDGLKSSNISINDTYPGDVFATIPVIGRSNGPVLQYLGTRTEYRRDLSIELVFDTKYGSTTTTTTAAPASQPGTTTTTTLSPSSAQFLYKTNLLLSKPTLWDPARTHINNIIKALSPAYELGVRKYFLNPPQESWNPIDGTYNLTLSWTYELEN